MTIETANNPVKLCGETLSTIWWQGKQWAVTRYGIEARDGRYCIGADRLAETWSDRPGIPGLLRHMVEKNWVDIPDFCTAFTVALVLHGHGNTFQPEDIRKMFD
jgi:hypothetical protein